MSTPNLLSPPQLLRGISNPSSISGLSINTESGTESITASTFERIISSRNPDNFFRTINPNQLIINREISLLSSSQATATSKSDSSRGSEYVLQRQSTIDFSSVIQGISNVKTPEKHILSLADIAGIELSNVLPHISHSAADSDRDSRYELTRQRSINSSFFRRINDQVDSDGDSEYVLQRQSRIDSRLLPPINDSAAGSDRDSEYVLQRQPKINSRFLPSINDSAADSDRDSRYELTRQRSINSNFFRRINDQVDSDGDSEYVLQGQSRIDSRLLPSINDSADDSDSRPLQRRDAASHIFEDIAKG